MSNLLEPGELNNRVVLPLRVKAKQVYRKCWLRRASLRPLRFVSLAAGGQAVRTATNLAARAWPSSASPRQPCGCGHDVLNLDLLAGERPSSKKSVHHLSRTMVLERLPTGQGGNDFNIPLLRTNHHLEPLKQATEETQ